MLKTLKTAAVAAGALCLVATTVAAAEKRVPVTLPQVSFAAAVAVPVAEGEATEKRIQLAQRRGGRGFRGRGRGGRVYRGRRRGRRIGRGIALGIGALAIGAIAAEAARAERYRYGRRCRIWLRDCEDGFRRACRRYDNNC